MPRQPDFFDSLTEEQLEALEAFARKPGTTVNDVVGWIATETGRSVSRDTAWRWKRKFDERVIAERMSSAGSLARTLIEAAKESGGLAVHDAAILQLGQQIFEAASIGENDPEKLNILALSMQRLTLAKKRVEEVRGRFDELTKPLIGRQLSQSDLDDVREKMFA